MGGVLVLLLLLISADHGQADCSVDVNGPQKLYPQPLLLKPGGSKDIHGFMTPDSRGFISLRRGQQIIIACPNSVIMTVNQSQVNAICFSNTTFLVNGNPRDFFNLKCKARPIPSAKTTGAVCGRLGQYQMLEGGFQVGYDFYTLIDVCFDSRSYSTVYTHSTIVAEIAGKQKRYQRRSWIQGNFFGTIKLDYQYTCAAQVNTVSILLGSRSLAQQYISCPDTSYLAKGHLSANCDYMLGAQQDATLIYTNAAPQWQRFNVGNWKTMEGNIRAYVSKRRVQLEIYTGTHGVTMLPDINGHDTELYLYVNSSNTKLIPVPKIFWKIVYDQNTQAAVVLVGVNNPHVSNPNNVVCTDVCNAISWLTWKSNNMSLGYSYCCSYSDFKNAVVDVPNLNVIQLLT